MLLKSPHQGWIPGPENQGRERREKGAGHENIAVMRLKGGLSSIYPVYLSPINL